MISQMTPAGFSPGQAGQVDGPFRLAGADQDAAARGPAEGKMWPGRARSLGLASSAIAT